MSAAHGRIVGMALCKALGLDENKVTYISVACSLNAPAVVTVRALVPSEDVEGFVETLTRYRLVEDVADA